MALTPIPQHKNAATLDAWFKTLYHQLHAGTMTRRDYVANFDACEGRVASYLSEQEYHNLLYRVDGRTLGEFALAIYDNTARERNLLDTWVVWCQNHRIFADAIILDCGMDNSGRLVTESRYVNHRPDFDVTIAGIVGGSLRGRHLFEIKYAPNAPFLTFKVSDLQAYAKARSEILLFVGRSDMLGGNGDPAVNASTNPTDQSLAWWGLITTEAITRLLTLPAKVYFGYMGNKPSVRLYYDREPEIGHYCHIYHWSC